jgi:hypothetical protein
MIGKVSTIERMDARLGCTGGLLLVSPPLSPGPRLGMGDAVAVADGWKSRVRCEIGDSASSEQAER